MIVSDKKIKKAEEASTEKLIELLERLDNLFPGHGDRIQRLSRVWLSEFPNSVKITKLEEALSLYLLCYFHDIGKICGIQEAREHPRNHCFLGNVIARNNPELKIIKDLILLHHETWNGLGCHGVVGADTPIICRMLSILNFFDALVYKRSFNSPQASKEVAIERIFSESGNKFDPDLVPVAIKVLEKSDLN